MDPARQPPPGPDTNLGPTVIALNCVLFTGSCLIVIFRTGTRIWLTHNFGWDDAVMVLAQVINACGMGFVGAEVSNGLGRHRYYLPAGGYKKFLKYDYLDWAQVFATLMLSKISICLFLLRLSNFRRLRLGLYALIALLITSHVPLFFLIIFQCSPIRKYWVSPLKGPGTCFTRATVETIIIIQGVPNALARILEINLGIIAACTPIMKPLIRYVRARVTGNDPHEMLYRATTATRTPSHTTWYTRFKGGPRKYGSTSNKSVPWNLFHDPSPQLPSKQDITTQQSLGLPLEGPMVHTHIEGGTGRMHKESERSLQSQLGLAMDVQDRV
ncbi:MAG: hypothetical protein LQ350_000598 [Teloschistes chrysophthalmus]|nr:MAG: hypothetical protein LQ350_000598 [Niorma chrysophthalma]